MKKIEIKSIKKLKQTFSKKESPYNTHTNMNTNMNYKTAVKNLFQKKKKKRTTSDPFCILKQLPKGWIYLPRHDKTTKYYENRTKEEIEEFEHELECKRKNQIAMQYIERFIQNTTLKMICENFTDEEIHDYIENIFEEEEECGEYSEEDYDWEYESDGSMYSDN